ncbi:MAG: hypothetical protein JWP48_1052 [Actinoallomurus sp.]|nr:hypothetical protein [Actinoallomurus sp.]
MPNGLFEVPVVMLMRSAPLTADIGPLIGIAAAVLAAILAAHASWHITDRIMSWRQRADQDEF